MRTWRSARVRAALRVSGRSVRVSRTTVGGSGVCERTLAIVGQEPNAITQAVIARDLLGTLDHAVYLGRELERASAALETGHVYVQDGGDVSPYSLGG